MSGVVLKCFGLVAAVSLTLGGGAPAARADEPAPEDPATRHREQGKQGINRGDYEQAVSEFRHAYEAKADPMFLHDIAEAYRRLGNKEQAIFFYRRYLATYPDAPNRALVMEHVANLRGAPEPALLPSPLPPLPPATPPESAPLARRSILRRPWVWASVGTVLAAGIGIFFFTRQSDDRGRVPMTDLGNARYF